MFKKKAIVVTGFIILSGLVIVGQFIPVNRTNPLVESDIPCPSEVKKILKTSCYDCHSNETVWPWYSKVAPVSWLVAVDTAEGRERLNFSTWNRYPPDKRIWLLDGIFKEIHEGEMPPWLYTVKHSGAKLSPEKINVLENWISSMRNTPRKNQR